MVKGRVQDGLGGNAVYRQRPPRSISSVGFARVQRVHVPNHGVSGIHLQHPGFVFESAFLITCLLGRVDVGDFLFVDGNPMGAWAPLQCAVLNRGI